MKNSYTLYLWGLEYNDCRGVRSYLKKGYPDYDIFTVSGGEASFMKYLCIAIIPSSTLALGGSTC